MSQTKKCIFTGIDSVISVDQTNDEISFSSIVGLYILSEDLWIEATEGKYLELTPQNRANCARWCLEIKKQNPKAIPVWILKEEFATYREKIELRNSKSKMVYTLCTFEDVINQNIDHSEKPFELLLALSEDTYDKSAYSFIKLNQLHLAWARINDFEEYFVILKFLLGKELLALPSGYTIEGKGIKKGVSLFRPQDVPMQISVNGWEYLRGNVKKTKSNKVFIATAFEWPEDESIRMEAISAIKIACKNLGYQADIVSQHHTENITNRILSEIRESSFVIAELTYHNRGVYFESGYARGLGKNVFHVVRKGFTSIEQKDDAKGRRIHFDIAQVLFKVWDSPEDLRSGLEDWINATVGKF